MTDNAGATGAVTKSVTLVTVAPVVAKDAFARTVTGGWGAADVGGPWAATGTASRWSVDGQGGLVSVSAGSGPTARLGVSAADIDATVKVSADKAATGGGLYVSVIGRSVAGVGDYRAKLRLTSTGAVVAALTRTLGATSTDVATPTVPGLTFAAGDTLAVRFQAFGTAPTTLRAKVWKDGTREPATWAVAATDASPDLAVPGGFALLPYVSGSATNAPIVFRFSALEVSPFTP